MSGLIAIVGRPNVGKSALFNRIARRRIAIVHDEPGVTRDRVSVEAEWHGRVFTLVDTGGIGLKAGEKARDIITQAALEQVELAIEAASAIILVVNVQEGIVPLDQDVAARLRKSEKPVLVAVNKVDSPKAEAGVEEFSRLGFSQMFPLTAIHGMGVEALMDAAMQYLPKLEAPAAAGSDEKPAATLEGEEEFLGTGEEEPPALKPEGPLKLAFVGRPNVGKSSLINALTQSERVIVSPIPGTTRDSVDVPFEVETEGIRESYILIDTAGVRQERKIDNSIEFFSVKRTEESIARCDIAIFVVDAESGVTAHDKKVAGKILEERKACIVIVNKWDLVGDTVLKARKEEIQRRESKAERGKEQMTTLAEFGQWVQEYLFFLDYAPVIFTSAKSGFHLERLLEAIRYVAAQLQQKIPTSLLNRTLAAAIEHRQPVSSAGHRLKFFYATQVKTAPPTFLLFVNRGELFSDTYSRYLSRELRKAFGYEGCPIVLIGRDRPKTVEPVRKYATPEKSKAPRPEAGKKKARSGKQRAAQNLRRGR